MRRQWLWLVCAVLLLPIWSCGEAPREQPQEGPRERPIGSVVNILYPAGFINGQQIGAGTDIPSGAILSTDNSGVIEFLLQGASTACQLRPQSQVVIQVSQDATLRYEQGSIWCQASAASQQDLVIDAGARQLRVKEARFGLRQSKNGTELVIDPSQAANVSLDSRSPSDFTTAGAETPSNAQAEKTVLKCPLETESVSCTSYYIDSFDEELFDNVEKLHKLTQSSRAPSPSPTATEVEIETPTPSPTPTTTEVEAETPTPSPSPTTTEVEAETPTPSPSPTTTEAETETPTPQQEEQEQ
jgi:hypothetical protein